MHIYAVDLGHYSVKFIEGILDKKGFYLDSYHETIVSDVMKEMDEETPLLEAQCEIIKSFLQNVPEDARVVFKIPNRYITSRYITLPINNKKKAEQMIPFQVDEDIPFQLSEAHYVYDLIKKQEQYFAQIYISQIDQFDSFYSSLEKCDVLPSVISCENSLIQSYINYKRMSGSFCILDIGHETTKAYFVQNRSIVTNHVSHVAGKLIDEVIAKTYNITNAEATIYKHNNCFLLTDEQYESVNEDQRNFALLMKHTLTPLIDQFKRWELGHRVEYAHIIDKVYIIGGTTKIQNFKNFLSQAITIKVEDLNPYFDISTDTIEIERENWPTFSMAELMAITQMDKLRPVNFLTKNYALSTGTGISLHSSVFIFSRALSFCLIISFFLFVQYKLLKREESGLDKKISKLVKAPIFNIPKRVQRSYKKNPAKILKLVKKQNKNIGQEIKLIQSAIKKDASKPLAKLGPISKSVKDIELNKFETDSFKSTAYFNAKTEAGLKELFENLKVNGHSKMKINKEEKVLKLIFEE
jgi:general secretion pathway protein L